jgi:hypothetical protein
MPEENYLVLFGSPITSVYGIYGKEAEFGKHHDTVDQRATGDLVFVRGDIAV